jgi:formate dehydrogenase
MQYPGTAETIREVAVATPDQLRERIRQKSRLKGRQPEEDALRQVGELLGPRPDDGYPRELLIEYLHKVNDAHGCLHDHHLVALAKLMNIPMAEVFEVATFYHHFEVVRGGDAAPGLTVRVCDSLACQLAGARDLLARLPALLGAAGRDDVRVIPAPCIGRCEQAPAVAVHQRAVPLATADKVLAAVASGESLRAEPPGRAGPSPASSLPRWRSPSWPRCQGRSRCSRPTRTTPPTVRMAATSWPPRWSATRSKPKP